MNDVEVRLRCIEAAARAPNSHVNGYAAGVLEAATAWAVWALDASQEPIRLTARNALVSPGGDPDPPPGSLTPVPPETLIDKARSTLGLPKKRV